MCDGGGGSLIVCDGGGGSLIVCDGGDCRCEVPLQSYSPSNVELGLRNAHCWVSLMIFLWGVEIY